MTDWGKFHSAVRWGKPTSELAAFDGVDGLVESKDEKNGNFPLHIACQNGHMEITKWLVVEKKVNVNVQNNKGQTPLHMSVAYDFLHQTKLLLDNKADGSIANGEGNKAIDGIDGDKNGKEAWDAPIQYLRAANDKASMDLAFDKIEGDLSNVDKAEVAKTGMILRKGALKDCWDKDRFTAICQKL